MSHANIFTRIFMKLRHAFLFPVDRRIDELEGQLRHVQHTVEVKSEASTSSIHSRIDNLAQPPGLMYISPEEVVSKMFDGTKIYLDPRDVAVAPHLVLDGIWEGWITKAWLSVVKSESVIFDVGANFGYFGILAAQHVNRKKSKVVYFEPNPFLLPYIKKSLAVNWINENAVIENLGVADKAGTAELHILKDYIGSSSLHSMEHMEAYMGEKMYLEVAKTVKVKTVSIDDYCKDHNIAHIDLMKMDIEGYEEKAYAGMKRMVRESPGLILFIEFTKDSYEDPRAFYDEMVKDFGHLYVIDSNSKIVKPADPSYEHVIAPADDWVMLVLSKKSISGE